MGGESVAVLSASPGVVFSTRRVVKTSPGVVARKSGTLPHGTLWPRNLIPYIEQHLISFYL